MQETFTEYTVWSVSSAPRLLKVYLLIESDRTEKLLDVLFLYTKIPPTELAEGRGRLDSAQHEAFGDAEDRVELEAKFRKIWHIPEMPTVRWLQFCCRAPSTIISFFVLLGVESSHLTPG